MKQYAIFSFVQYFAIIDINIENVRSKVNVFVGTLELLKRIYLVTFRWAGAIVCITKSAH